MTRRAPRHASRQLALQALYAADLAAVRTARLGQAAPGPTSQATIFADVAANFDLAEGARAFAEELVTGVLARRAQIDAILADHTRNWRVERMAAVDRNVLRIAVFELLETATPTSVVLDEAIELARRFGDEPSPAFVNGVLHAVAQDMQRPLADARPGEGA